MWRRRQRQLLVVRHRCRLLETTRLQVLCTASAILDIIRRPRQPGLCLLVAEQLDN
jgi:hypothetical protein